MHRNPSDVILQVLPERLAKSTALGQVNRLKKELKTAEVEMEHTGKKTPEAEKEVRV